MVTLTRSVAVQGRIDFADLNSERQRRFIAAYSQSKLANLIFAIEMDRRAKEAALPLASIAANPGTVMTACGARSGTGGAGDPGPTEMAVAVTQRLLGQPPRDGCLTSLYAAADPGLRGGEYIAPASRGHKRGAPAPARLPRRALDPVTARQLWEISASLTGVNYSALNPPDSRGTATRAPGGHR